MKRVGQIRERIWKDVKAYLPTAGLVAVLWIGLTLVFGAMCPSVLIFGLPCPGCGMTRAAVSLFTGNWQEVMQYNPMVIFWLGAVLTFLYLRYVKDFRSGRKGVDEAGGSSERAVKFWWRMLIVLVLVTTAVFIIRMYLYFPGEAPLVYTPGNLLERLLPGYEKLVRLIVGKR